MRCFAFLVLRFIMPGPSLSLNCIVSERRRDRLSNLPNHSKVLFLPSAHLRISSPGPVSLSGSIFLLRLASILIRSLWSGTKCFRPAIFRYDASALFFRRPASCAFEGPIAQLEASRYHKRKVFALSSN